MASGTAKNGINKGWFKKGRIIPKEIIEKMGNAHLGKKHSLKTKEKMSKSQSGHYGWTKGKPTWNKGIKWPEMVGINNPNWKGGITPENVKIRKSFKYDTWRNEVFNRDNFIDQKTGIRGGNLIAHHILSFAEYPELRFDISNGITLSKESHKEFHKIYGKKNNTREQLKEFLNIKL